PPGPAAAAAPGAARRRRDRASGPLPGADAERNVEDVLVVERFAQPQPAHAHHARAVLDIGEQPDELVERDLAEIHFDGALLRPAVLSALHDTAILHAPDVHAGLPGDSVDESHQRGRALAQARLEELPLLLLRAIAGGEA